VDSKTTPNNQEQVTDRPPGYQPSPGRKLFMLGLCVAGLIMVWIFYFLSR
jgi:hypothetical protein